ncbi:hypothetical protein GCM10009716_13950 [Streptomyces sodiiphilus]|uniref:TadE-like domain-containing protein n=1 Tax=Streptomyces sodiiphilus TaxID=226217 RepID=A0ABN2NWD3_9ACTN
MRTPYRAARPAPARRSPRSDRGATAVEFAGWLPLLVLVALAALQLGFIGYAAQQAGSAARAAARVASQQETEDQYQSAGRAAASSWLQVAFTRQPCGEEVTVTASVTVPSVLPFMGGALGEASKSVTMPCD